MVWSGFFVIHRSCHRFKRRTEPAVLWYVLPPNAKIVPKAQRPIPLLGLKRILPVNFSKIQYAREVVNDEDTACIHVNVSRTSSDAPHNWPPAEFQAA